MFYLERHETLFRGLFEIQTENEKIKNFGPKPWTNHFGEIQILPLFNLTFHHLKRLIFHLEHHERLFMDLFHLKNRELIKCKFLTKTMD